MDDNDYMSCTESNDSVAIEYKKWTFAGGVTLVG